MNDDLPTIEDAFEIVSGDGLESPSFPLAVTGGGTGQLFPVFDTRYRITLDVGKWENKPDNAEGYFVEVSRAIAKNGSERTALALSILRDEAAEVRATLDELLAAGVEPDGDEPITDEWLESTFGLKCHPFGVYESIDRQVCAKSPRLGYHDNGMSFRTRRDFRDLIRLRRQWSQLK